MFDRKLVLLILALITLLTLNQVFHPFDDQEPPPAIEGPAPLNLPKPEEKPVVIAKPRCPACLNIIYGNKDEFGFYHCPDCGFPVPDSLAYPAAPY